MRDLLEAIAVTAFGFLAIAGFMMAVTSPIWLPVLLIVLAWPG